MSKYSADELEVVVLIERYVKGYIDGDGPALRDVFAGDAVMNGYVDGRLIEGTPDPFIQNVSSNPSLKSSGLNPEYKIEHISVTGNAAAVVLSEIGFGPYNFRDYMHLLKRDGVWQIISKTFTTW